jgi:NodT family efflux transporter outer membrane factor (OMF) lipoprotein
MEIGLGTRAVCAIAILLLAGCAGLKRSPHVAPDTRTPREWQHASAGEQAKKTEGWWRSFGDAELETLIDTALTRNTRIAEAAIAVRRAQLEAGLAEDRSTPSFSTPADTEMRRGLGSSNNMVTRTFSVTSGVSHDLDMWGKLATEYDAATLEARATAEDKENIALSVVGTTMTLYWRIAYLNERIALAGQNVAALQRILDLTRVRHESGALSRFDVHQAEQVLFAQRANLSQLQQQRVENHNALAILLDGPAQAPRTEPLRLPRTALPGVDLGLPAHMLGRRPDLRAAELRLREALAISDAARASFYPTLKLTGGLGSTSIELAQILKNPVAALGAGVTLPFLQWKERQLNREIAKSDYEKAIVTFRAALYRAFSEVENALSARSRLEEQHVLLEKSLAAAEEMTRITEIRYRAGAIQLNILLDAQQTRRDAEAAMLENRVNRLTNIVDLFIALGGEARAVQ